MQYILNLFRLACIRQLRLQNQLKTKIKQLNDTAVPNKDGNQTYNDDDELLNFKGKASIQDHDNVDNDHIDGVTTLETIHNHSNKPNIANIIGREIKGKVEDVWIQRMKRYELNLYVYNFEF